ncbi:MAG TPA: baseplate J/gp47 family protein [Bacillota bacterium]|nr:baseplate J/gp47 family protein [Bacillota bacterium]
MSLPLPDLDDRSFEELVNEARGLIPVYCKDWTHHNPSDPGVTILELFAWLSETLMYRINQVPESHYRKFLELIFGAPLKAEDTLAAEIPRALKELHQTYRAVTPEDYEFLARECMQLEFVKSAAPNLRSRAIALNNRDLEYRTVSDLKPGHVTVMVIPGNEAFLPSAALKNIVWNYLEERRLITTRVHVTGPFYRKFTLEIALAFEKNAREQGIRSEISAKIKEYFSPLTGGPEGKGWPLGRGVYPSEIFRLVERTSGVDHAQRLIIRDEDEKKVSFIKPAAHELMFLQSEPIIT